MFKLTMSALVALTINEATSLPISLGTNTDTDTQPLPHCDTLVATSPPDGTDCQLASGVGCYDNTANGKYYLECNGDTYCRKAGQSWGNEHIQADWTCTLQSNGPPKPAPPALPPAPPSSPAPDFTRYSLTHDNLELVDTDVDEVIEFEGLYTGSKPKHLTVGSGATNEGGAISPAQLDDKLEKAKSGKYAGIFVDFESVANFGGTCGRQDGTYCGGDSGIKCCQIADIVDGLTQFLDKAHEAKLTVSISTGGDGFTAQLCGGMVTDSSKCEEAMAKIFALKWDVWMPQMYDAYMNNDALFAATEALLAFKGKIVPVVGFQTSSSTVHPTKALMMTQYEAKCAHSCIRSNTQQGFCDNDTSGNKLNGDHSNGYTFLKNNNLAIAGLAAYPWTTVGRC